ncbi:putative glucan synthesis regulatory protein [Diplogelasinospora grovesii]|uniref:Glucan synthesis regulatory protein n=1 Tax=Diplogelasinospora grovesii TaxID=303347 RepID=A0AAN6S898_9PEZI|nr:putative glucan synthesis regulatory protein [Diplogelasinospora grovesii]
MANPIGSLFRDIWHTMTSYDRHSTVDSPYRTGRHVPLNRHPVLTSVATASESRGDITSPYHDETGRHSSGMDRTTSYGGSGVDMAAAPMSPGSSRPYSPGMRSMSQRQNSDGFEMASPHGEIPMQSFRDGLPPPPSVESSWSKIDKWADENYPELFDQLCEGCTVNDLNELEHQLDCTLPQDVRESLAIHDGQERGGTPTGIIFGSMLLDCEEIVQEWENWRKVNQEFLADTATIIKPSVPLKALGGSSSSSGQASSSKAGPSNSRPASPHNPNWRQDLLAKQDCVPPNAVQKAYAHPAWIPLVRDWGGNNLAVDLAPGPKGQWGQIILFGRDYDTKYVVARSWASLLAIVADDLGSGRWFVDEDTGELKLREFKRARVEPAYFEILRWRMDQKYGRIAAKRKSVVPGAASPTGSASPYASPVEPNGEAARGRSMQRLSLNGSPLASPIRPGQHNKPPTSPLARVAEEAPLSLVVNGSALQPPQKLVEVDTPRPSEENNKTAPRLEALTNGESSTVETTKRESVQSNGSAGTAKMNGKQPAVVAEEAMKEIEI